MFNDPDFLLAGCVDWSTVEDFTWWGFKAYNSPFCISGSAMGSLILHSQNDFNNEVNREQSLIPFLLQTFLSLSYMLNNSMLQELFGEASKRRNNKQEKKKIEQEKL